MTIANRAVAGTLGARLGPLAGRSADAPAAACRPTAASTASTSRWSSATTTRSTWRPATAASTLPEQRRLVGWFEAMDLRYGDRVSIDDPAGKRCDARRGRGDRRALRPAARDGAPVTAGYVQPGTVRVVVTRVDRLGARLPRLVGASTTSTSNNATSPGLRLRGQRQPGGDGRRSRALLKGADRHRRDRRHELDQGDRHLSHEGQADRRVKAAARSNSPSGGK